MVALGLDRREKALALKKIISKLTKLVQVKHIFYIIPSQVKYSCADVMLLQLLA